MSELAWDAAHEAWAAAQLAPGEGIEEGAARVAAVIEKSIAEATQDLRADRDSWIQQASDRAQDALDLVAAERERCARMLLRSNSALLLMAGEMTARELRTVQAVLHGIRAQMKGDV